VPAPSILRYRISGLIVASEIDLGRAVTDASATPPDVTVRIGQLAPVCGGLELLDTRLLVEGTTTRMEVGRIGRYEIKHGSEVVVDPEEPRDDLAQRLCLAGAVFAVLYHQRGLLPLHASAVALADGSCVAFLGPVGHGKSTTAAFLNRRGYPLMGDDSLVVEVPLAAVPQAYSNLPMLGLRAPSVEALGLGASELMPYPFEIQRWQAIPRSVAAPGPFPLRTIYVLDWGSDLAPHVEPLSPSEALRYLLIHTYRRQHVPAERLSEHFKACVRLQERVPMYRLVRLADPHKLTASLDLLEESLARLT
jgi:hypothetical protein